jgi:hypothetical protein
MSMKRSYCFSINCILNIVFLLAMIQVQKAWSQDYLDVPAGFETLNLAVAGDSLPNGTRNPNRVYRLENGGFYLINGTINNSLNGGFEMHVQAADPSGHCRLLSHLPPARVKRLCALVLSPMVRSKGCIFPAWIKTPTTFETMSVWIKMEYR